MNSLVSLLLLPSWGERESERVDNRRSRRKRKVRGERWRRRTERKKSSYEKIDTGSKAANDLDYAKMSYDSIRTASVNVLKRADARYHSPRNSISLK